MTPPKVKRKSAKRRKSPSFKADWPKVLEVGAEIVREHTERYGQPPDLRTPFYELGSRGLLPNTKGAYKGEAITKWWDDEAFESDLARTEDLRDELGA